jgi:hypothetical protein
MKINNSFESEFRVLGTEETRYDDMESYYNETEEEDDVDEPRYIDEREEYDEVIYSKKYFPASIFPLDPHDTDIQVYSETI